MISALSILHDRILTDIIKEKYSEKEDEEKILLENYASIILCLKQIIENRNEVTNEETYLTFVDLST